MTDGGRYYLLLDEVQEIDGWEKAVNSLLEDADTDIYVTGANSRLMSSEISIYLSGRYISIPVYTGSDMANAIPVPEMFCDDSYPYSGDDLPALCGTEPDGPAWSIAESRYFSGGHMLVCTGISAEDIKENGPR